MRTESISVPVRSDLGGEAPIDHMYSGETGVVSVELTWWDEGVLNVIRDRGKPPGQPATPGFQGPGEVGSLMMTEGVGYPLWLKFPYRSKPAYANMIPGYHFLAAFLDPDEMEGGTRNERRYHLVWRCMRVFNFTTGTFQLYDQADASFAGLAVA